MRLVCPNCDAEYEVDASLVPPEGRDVQCSNCGNTWFQSELTANAPASAAPEPASEPEPTPEPAMQRPATDPKALDIIHEEVARENQARQAESGALETQTDLGLDTAPPPPPPSQRMAADVEEAFPEVEDDLSPAPKRGESAGKRELLPDIEEINSTLAAAPTVDGSKEEAEEEAYRKPRRRSGFRIGFGLTMMLTAALLLAYAYAPSIAERVPGMTDTLASYVAFVDQARVNLGQSAENLLEKVNELTERFRNQ